MSSLGTYFLPYFLESKFRIKKFLDSGATLQIVEFWRWVSQEKILIKFKQ